MTGSVQSRTLVEYTWTHGAKQRRRLLVTTIPITPSEQKFLLVRLCDVSGTAEAIVHHPRGHRHISPWDRHQAVSKILGMVDALRRHPEVLMVLGDLAVAIVREAFEGNPYFARMASDDPRLCAAAIRQVDALHLKVSQTLGIRIGPVPLGQGRSRRRGGQHGIVSPTPGVQLVAGGLGRSG